MEIGIAPPTRPRLAATPVALTPSLHQALAEAAPPPGHQPRAHRRHAADLLGLAIFMVLLGLYLVIW